MNAITTNKSHENGGPDDNQAQGGHLIAHSLSARHDSGEDGTGRGTPIVPILEAGARQDKENRSNPKPGDPCHPLAEGAHPPAIVVPSITSHYAKGEDSDCTSPLAITFKPSHFTRGKDGAPSETLPPLSADADVAQVQWASGGGKMENNTAQSLRAGAEHNYQFLRDVLSVRRITPVECERLMGFPDHYTRIAWRGKAAELCPDGPRYRALGNSMAVPVMRWIGERIGMVEEILA